MSFIHDNFVQRVNDYDGLEGGKVYIYKAKYNLTNRPARRMRGSVRTFRVSETLPELLLRGEV